MLNFFKRLKKRQVPAATAALTTQFPYGSGLGGISKANIASIKRCLSIYSNFLKILQLEPEDHYLTKLIETGPFPSLNKNTFYDILTEDAFLYGQHISRLKIDNDTGKIVAFFPYPRRAAVAYPRSGGYDNPASIWQGFYYRSHFDSAVWERDTCFHYRHTASGDLLNAYPPIYTFAKQFLTAEAAESVLQGLAFSGGRGAVLITGFAQVDTEEQKKAREILTKQLQSGLRSTSSQVLTMPPGIKPEPLLQQNSHAIFPFISEQSMLEIAQIFSIPHELLVVGKTSLQSMKEITRHFVRTTLRSFADSVAKEISRAAADGTDFAFNMASLRHSDARETSQFLSQLVQTEVLSPKEAKEILEDDL